MPHRIELFADDNVERAEVRVLDVEVVQVDLMMLVSRLVPEAAPSHEPVKVHRQIWWSLCNSVSRFPQIDTDFRQPKAWFVLCTTSVATKNGLRKLPGPPASPNQRYQYP